MTVEDAGEQPVRDVLLEREPVELFKLLKFEGLAGSGGEAKQLIADGLVEVNGVVEFRKRRKIVAGDLIIYDQQVIRAIGA